ncbi:MAG: hypothetical protein ACFB0G_11095 [Leptolyngbyaceae cyanobacterium]
MKAAKTADENYRYYWGQHFDFWVGPTIPDSDPTRAEKMQLLQRVFQMANIILECCNNWRNGLIAEPFLWHLTDENGDRVDSEAAQRAEATLKRWLDWVQEQSFQADPSTTNFKQSSPWHEFVLSLGVLGEGALRLWQPQRYANNPDDVKRIHLHAPKCEAVSIVRSSVDGFIDEIRYAYAQGSEKHTLTDTQASVEIDGQADDLAVDTGGRWLIQYVCMPSIITETAKSLQNSINHALTMKLRNNEVAGFRERVFANAEPPKNGEERGPGRDYYVYGVPTGTQDQPSYASPEMFESQPVDTSNLVRSIELDRAMIYRSFSQAHLLDTDSGISGESRIQQRQSFELTLNGDRLRIEAAIANILNIVLRLLGHEEFTATVQLQITTGKLSAEERRSIMEQHNGQLLSRSTALARLGEDDPQAEIILIEEERSQATASPIVANGLVNPLDAIDRENN